MKCCNLGRHISTPKHLLPNNLATMFKAKIPLPLLLFLHLLLQETGQAAAAAAAADSQATEHCESSSCGEIPIRAPFRLTTDPGSCDDRKFNLSCESNTTVLLLQQYRGWMRYYVKAINYNNSTVRLVDDGVVNGNCSSLPNHSWVSSFFGDLNDYGPRAEPLAQGLALINCDNPVVQSTTTTTTRTQLVYVETSPCIDLGPSSSSSYALIGGTTLYDLPKMCSVEMTTGIPYNYYSSYTNVTFQEIHRQLEYGFELTWLHQPNQCRYDMCFYGFCYCYGPSDVILWIGRYFEKWIIILAVVHRMILLVLGTPAIIALLVYKWRRRHESAYHSIEEFLQNQAHLMPIRYSYYHIKKITGGFKDKLGQGGFGSVYKAKLRGGGFAAVKMLRTNNKVLNPTAAARKGQDFMNEVATIGRIHHANVVRLMGYCSEGSKQVLVYEFMPNGSLDKHISHDNDDGGSDQNSSSNTSCLSLEQLYRISLGVAHGIEYLHSGCDIQILHFDIKPHNILLDENFTPKVSDFGLARLNQAGRDNNIATLTAARGTIGYMAPELFYKNIGGVSYKADVYSFGMLLLEMTGKRGNLNATETDQSTAYFPSWVHNEVSSPGTPIAVGEVKEEEDNIAKKMVMVGLWCIQTKPDDRPPMNKVVEMLEGDLESLQLPPKPVLFAAEAIRKNEEGSSSSFVSSSEYTQSALSNQYDDESLSKKSI